MLNQVSTHLAASFLQGVQEAIAETDYSPLFFFMKSPESQDVCLDHCLSREVDALLINCSVDPARGRPEAFARRLAGLKIPIVEAFGHFLPGIPKANVDNVHAGATCAGHLIGLGHRRIALITHSRYENRDFHNDAWEGFCGYRAAIEAAGLEPMLVTVDVDFVNVSTESFLWAGEDALDALLAMPDPPTAVVCYNDYIAYGLNRACRAKGLDVPGAISIVGNADLMLSSVLNPPLTTTQPRYFEIGRRAAAGLLAAIDGRKIADMIVAPELVIRKSTGSAPR